jgi:8-oxo-dGTP diphosphatase
MKQNHTIGVGVAVFVWRNGKFLMYRRKGSHANGTISVPGGHLEFGESWADCAARESLEEAGIHIKNIQYLAVTNDIMPTDDKHYISIWMTADFDEANSNEPQIMEPTKMEAIEWHTFQDLPSPLFEPCWTNLRADKPELFN